jgi:hypothetical protein
MTDHPHLLVLDMQPPSDLGLFLQRVETLEIQFTISLLAGLQSHRSDPFLTPTENSTLELAVSI